MGDTDNQQERPRRRNIEKILRPNPGEIFFPYFGAMRYVDRTGEIIEHHPGYRRNYLFTAVTLAIAHGLMIITPAYALFRYLTE